MKKVFIIIVGLLSAAYIYFSLTELENIRAALNKGNPLLLFAAVAVEALLLLNSTFTFQALYKLVDLQETKKNMVLLVTAAAFVNIVAPTAGVGGMAVFVESASRKGLPSGRAVIVGVLYLLYEYISLFVVLLIGFMILIEFNQLKAGEVVAACSLLLLAVAVGAMVVIGYNSARQLGKILAWFARWANRFLRPFIRKDCFDEKNAYLFADEMAEGVTIMRGKRHEILLPLVFTLANKALLITILSLAFISLGIPFHIKTSTAGFALAQLLFYVSPTPSGVGFVDSILPVVLNSLGVAFSQAVLVTLVYRAISFWLPFGLGAIAFRQIQKIGRVPVSSSEEPGHIKQMRSP